MKTKQASIYGIMLMLLNMASIATSDICSKALREGMTSAHIVFTYKLLLLLIITPWVLSKGLDGLKTDKIHIHIIRSLLSVMGLLFFVHGLKYVNMADAAALENLQSIALAIIGGVFFSERLTKTKIIAAIIGFFGAIIVVKPSIVDWLIYGNDTVVNSDKYYGFTLIGIGFWILNSVTVKILGKTEKTKTQMFYLLFFACLWSAPAALVKWRSASVFGMELNVIPYEFVTLDQFNIQLSSIKFLLIMCVCQFIHGISYFKALKYDLSIVEPLRYTKLIFSALLGYLMFSESPAMESYLGYTCIVISGLLLVHYEVKKVRRIKKQ